MFRDLQVLSQLAWFDEEFLAERRGNRGAWREAAGISRSTTRRFGRKQREICGNVLPVYDESGRRPARSRSRRRLSITRSCRCSAIPTSPASRIRTCRCRRVPLSRRMRAMQLEKAREYFEAIVWSRARRAVAVGRLGVRRSLCALPPTSASTGSPPTTAFWPAPGSTPRRSTVSYRPYLAAGSKRASA